jgi:hypothetical protein
MMLESTVTRRILTGSSMSGARRNVWDGAWQLRATGR